MTTLKRFSDDDIRALAPALKIGLLATVNDEGQPHLTLLSSIKAASPDTLTFGQFAEGVSKDYVQRRPRAGFLVMTLQKELWRGAAAFTRTAKAGPDYDAYNDEPLFRYNSYFGIHTVYYLDLVGHTGRRPLPMGKVVAGSVATLLARLPLGSARSCRALNPWTRGLLGGMGNLKFASWVGEDGFPRIVPILQAQAAPGDRLLFSTNVYGDELEAIPEGAALAVFGMTLKMEDVLVRGRFTGIKRVCGVRCGTAVMDWAYNPMPPVPGRIWPPAALEPVRTF
jgi:hypothetical protein